MAKATKRAFPGHFVMPKKSGVEWQFDVKGKIEQASIVFGSHYEYGFIDLLSKKLCTYYVMNKDDITTETVLTLWYQQVIVPLRASDPTITKVYIHGDLG